MKKAALVLIMSTAIAMTSTPCFAFIFGVKAGAHFPTSDYNDIAETGFTAGLQFKMPIDRNNDWGLHVGYAETSGDETVSVAGIAIDRDVDVSMAEVYPFWDYHVIQRHTANLFFRAGAGANIWQIDRKRSRIETVNGTVVAGSRKSDDIDFMIALGPGIILYTHFEATLLYNRIITGDFDEGYVTLTIGYNFDFTPRAPRHSRQISDTPTSYHKIGTGSPD